MAFEIVSEKEWKRALSLLSIQSKITNIIEYEKLYSLIPTRSTAASAGYDFKIPFELVCEPNTPYCIPTGMKWNPSSYDVTNVVLLLFPRSSLGFASGFTLDNTIGVIDADYYNNIANEGHIFIQFSVKNPTTLKQGYKFCQGIILPFYIDKEDTTNTLRIGGMGSTNA